MTSAKLVCMYANDATPEILLQTLPVTLGRGPDADVRIADKCASRLHCRIVQVQDQLVVQDLGSTLGTLVNGRPIVESPLNPGDRLSIGISTFHVYHENTARGSLLTRIGSVITSLGSKLPKHLRRVDRARADSTPATQRCLPGRIEG